MTDEAKVGDISLESGSEAGKQAAQETAYAGSLATSETVERVMEVRAGSGPEPLALQGVLAELHRQATRYSPSRRVETA